MSDGTVSGIGRAINNYGTAIITGGTVSAVDSTAGVAFLQCDDNALTTIGNSSDDLSWTSPCIIGYKYGLTYLTGTTGGSWNFYNGILKGRTRSYVLAPTSVRDEYAVVSGYDGDYKTAYIGKPTQGNCEGYYADIDADGTVDGVIYADLMAGATSGTWSSSSAMTYSYTAITEAKEYYVSQESYTDDFGTKPVLSPLEGTTGNDRFYIMTLDNFTTSSYSTFYWYYNAYGNMSDYSTYTSTAFGTGKANTEAMITKWNNSGYGSKNARDLWGVIQTKADEGWFIPSKDEWIAFAAKLGITPSNYSSTFGLNNGYWSSSASGIKLALGTNFVGEGMSSFYVGSTKVGISYVRFGSTF